MRPFDTDENWKVIYTAVQLNSALVALPVLRDRLIEAYGFNTNQATVAAGMLITGSRDPSPDRKRLVANWSKVEQRGQIGFGEFRRTATEYKFRADYTYTYYFSTTSSYMSPPGIPLPGAPLVMRSPTLVEDRESGLYLVAARENGAAVCLCSDSGEARTSEFSFNADGSLSIKGLGSFRK